MPDGLPRPDRPRAPGGADPSRTVLPASGTMIGLCTTPVGLVKIVEGRSGASRVDEHGGIAALFLVSAVLSYLSTRTAGRPRLGPWPERVADAVFPLGLLGIVGLTLLFAYDRI